MSRRIRSAFLALTLLASVTSVAMAFTPSPAAAQSTDSANFQTPSGNINCALYEDPEGDYGSCVARNNVWKNPKKKPADCDLDWEPAEIGLSSEERGSSFSNRIFVGACRGDIGPLCDPNNCLTLAYGQSIKVGRITCTSRKSGVTCVTNRGRRRGFTIARAGYSLI
jgi:hypothetical protein